jgi:predicted ester cyclase
VSKTEDDNKALVRRYFDFLNQNNLPSEEFLSPEFAFHDPGMPDLTNLAGVREWIAALCNASPDQCSTIQDIIAEGDRVVCRWSTSAAYEKDFMGLPVAASTQRLPVSQSIEYLVARFRKNGTQQIRWA